MSNQEQSQPKLPAVVLAGGKADPELAGKYSVEYRAAVPINGRPMVQYVVDALRAASRVGEITLVGDVKCDGIVRAIPSADAMVENLLAGVKACASGDPACRVLISTSDIPLLTPEAVDDLVDRCLQHEADFFYPVIPKAANEERFPQMKRTYARLAEGTFTGGNIVVMNAGFVIENAGLIREAFNARKSIARLARLIGFGTLMRAVVAQVLWPGAINLQRLEKTVGRILNARIKAVPTSYAEIGADVDDAQQLELAETLLKGDRK